MRVNHRSADIGVAKQFLNGPNVVPVFQEVGGKGMPKSVWGCRLEYLCLSDGFFDCLL